MPGCGHNCVSVTIITKTGPLSAFSGEWHSVSSAGCGCGGESRCQLPWVLTTARCLVTGHTHIRCWWWCCDHYSCVLSRTLWDTEPLTAGPHCTLWSLSARSQPTFLAFLLRVGPSGDSGSGSGRSGPVLVVRVIHRTLNVTSSARHEERHGDWGLQRPHWCPDTAQCECWRRLVACETDNTVSSRHAEQPLVTHNTSPGPGQEHSQSWENRAEQRSKRSGQSWENWFCRPPPVLGCALWGQLPGRR